jgi:L-arabinonolactonase
VIRIRTVTDVRTTLGESPVWDPDSDRIFWVDSLGRAIYSATPDGGDLKRWETPANIGSMALRRTGGAVAAMKSGVHLIDFDTGEFQKLHDPEAHIPGNTLNDGKVDSQGRFWFGSMDISESGPNGSLYRLDADHSLQVVERGFTVSNGPCWSKDDTTFYFADSARSRIWAYDFESATGRAKNKRPFLDYPGPGLVDGATVDAEGFLWCAHVYGGKIARYSPLGDLDREVPLPVSAVTSVMFGGPNLDDLFVTTMAAPLDPTIDAGGPLAGCLFMVSGIGVRGRPENKFCG